MKAAWLAAGTLAVLIAAAPAARADDEQPPPRISTHATAHKRIPNTVADITLGIEASGADVAAVTRTLGERSTALMAFLRKPGIDRLETTGVAVQTRRHVRPDGHEVDDGFVGRVGVTFRCAAGDAGGEISGGLSHGANTLDNAAFSPADAEVEAARRDLALTATRMALDEARAVAGAAGVQVAGVQTIDVDPEGSVTPRPMNMTPRLAAAPMGAPPPIATASGSQDISVTVNVTVTLAVAH